MKILYYGVFDGKRWRAEYPMVEALKALGHTLHTANFRAFWKRKVRQAWQRHGSEVDLVFLQNGIPFSEADLQLITRPFVFLASEFSLSSARHILDSSRPPDLVLAHSQQTFDYCQQNDIPVRRVHLAYNAQIYRPLDLPTEYDLCFIGGMSPRRKQYIDALKAQGWRIFAGKVTDPDKINRIYNQSKIVLHIHAATETYIPVRLFEVMPVRACLLIESMGENQDPTLGNDFFESFDSVDSLIAKIEALLADPARRYRLMHAANGLAPAHSWLGRMQEYTGYFEHLLAQS